MSHFKVGNVDFGQTAKNNTKYKTQERRSTMENQNSLFSWSQACRESLHPQLPLTNSETCLESSASLDGAKRVKAQEPIVSAFSPWEQLLSVALSPIETKVFNPSRAPAEPAPQNAELNLIVNAIEEHEIATQSTCHTGWFNSPEHLKEFARFAENLRVKISSGVTSSSANKTKSKPMPLGMNDPNEEAGWAFAAQMLETALEDNSFKRELSQECEQWLNQAKIEVQAARTPKVNRTHMRHTEVCPITGSIQYFCDACVVEGTASGAPVKRKPFKTREGIMLHIKGKHENDKPWTCHAFGCSMAFVRQSDLKLHLIRMHSNARPCPCKHPMCCKSFASLGELRRHVRLDHAALIQALCGETPIDEDFFKSGSG